MPRIYLALEVDFDNDDKVALLARYTKHGEARACRDLLVAMWRYCKSEKTDGHVPFEIVGKLCYPDPARIGYRDADRLVEVGLAERTNTGYYFGQYLKRNKSRAQIEVEAAKKAEAGRKGGKASGLVRTAEAEVKHAASPVRSHTDTPTHRTPDTDNDSTSESGDRPVTLHAVTATVHTPITPADARCTGHVGVADTGPCHGCRASREKAERLLERDVERANRARESARLACTLCDGVWVLNEDATPSRRKCDHAGRVA